MSTFSRVAQWNTLCSKGAPKFGTREYYTVLDNQAKRIEEELEELKLALEIARLLTEAFACNSVRPLYHSEVGTIEITQENLNYWNQEILDAGCDLDVVVAGVNFLSGHDYEGAIDVVLNNNDVKYTPDIKFAQKSCDALGAGHSIKKVRIDIGDEDDEELKGLGYITFVSNGIKQAFVYSIHRDSDDKICKLLDHPKVDLEPFTKDYKGYTDAELVEFTRLVGLLDSSNQVDQAEGRMDMPKFVDLHGKDKCDLMFLTLS
jgi:hypothetical protein